MNTPAEPARWLPPDHGARASLHQEVHARPPARIQVPALIVNVAVLTEGVTLEQQWAHLRTLPGQEGLGLEALSGQFLRLHWPTHSLKWERHSEFSRYSLLQTVPEAGAALCLPPDWFAAIPGRTIAALQIELQHANLLAPQALLDIEREHFAERAVVASLVGDRNGLVVSDLHLHDDGFVRLHLLVPNGTSELRAGRMVQRLIEIDVYRMMALRGLPVAKQVGAELARHERALADITQQLESGQTDDAGLLEALISLASGVERGTAEHSYRFAATRAYHALVQQRIEELREQPLNSAQTLGAFMARRLSPAIATVAATAARQASLSERIERTGALLRTRVDIARETQNQQLLAKLTRGQALQLRLQATVEGLSIAAVSYYMVSLIGYLAKAGKAAGWHIEPELAMGAAVPLVLWAVWRGNRRMHRLLGSDLDGH